MLVGVLIGNIEFFKVFSVNAHWEFQARRMALAVLIIRWGLGLNLALIYESIVQSMLNLKVLVYRKQFYGSR